MFKKILLATDGSASSEKSTQLALNLAKAHGAQLLAVYVVDPYPYLGIGEVNPAGFLAYIEAAKLHAAEVHQHVLTQAQQSAPSVAVECILLEETTPSTGIIQTSVEHHCDLIVIGSHGRSGLGRLMLGSIATKVVNDSSIPVLVAR